MIVPASAEAILKAANILKRGGIVAFPTETVYGLGANALNEEAVNRVFSVKERPETHPLIVHVHDLDAIGQLSPAFSSAEYRAKIHRPTDFETAPA